MNETKPDTPTATDKGPEKPAVPAENKPKPPKLPDQIKDPRAEERKLAEGWLVLWRQLAEARRVINEHEAKAVKIEDDLVPYTDKLVGRGQRHIRCKDGTIVKVGRESVEVLEVE